MIGSTLYVHLAGDANPELADMSDLTFRYYGKDNHPRVSCLKNDFNNLVRGYLFSKNDPAIGIKRDASRNVIENNTYSIKWGQDPWKAYARPLISGFETLTNSE